MSSGRKMKDDTKNGFKGLWIPSELCKRDDLSWNEKALLAQIELLSKGKNGCIASNATLARYLGFGEKTVRNLLWTLRKKNALGPNNRFESRGRKLTRTPNPTCPGTGTDPSRSRDSTYHGTGTTIARPVPEPGIYITPGDNTSFNKKIHMSGSGDRAETEHQDFTDKKPTKDAPPSSLGNVANGNGANGAEGGTTLARCRGEAPSTSPQGTEPQTLVPIPTEKDLFNFRNFLEWYEDQCRLVKEPFSRSEKDYGFAKGTQNGFGPYWNAQTVQQVVEMHFRWAKGQKDIRKAITVACLMDNLSTYLAPIIAEEEARKIKAEEARRKAFEEDRPRREAVERKRKEQEELNERRKKFLEFVWTAYSTGLYQKWRFDIGAIWMGDPNCKEVIEVCKSLQKLPPSKVEEIARAFGVWHGERRVQENDIFSRITPKYFQTHFDKFLKANPDIDKQLQDARSATTTAPTAPVAVPVGAGCP